MDKTIRKYTDLMRWRPTSIGTGKAGLRMRMDAVEEMIQTAYALKGWEIEPDVPRLQDLLSAFHAHAVRCLIAPTVTPEGSNTDDHGTV